MRGSAIRMADPTDQEMLSAYKVAEQQIALGAAAEVHVADRVYKAADLGDIRAGIAFYQRRVNRAAGVPGYSAASF